MRHALVSGVVCGIQAFYGAGCGPEPCAFIDVDSYVRTVDRSRPGDWFTLWSIPTLAERSHLLVWKKMAPVTDIELESVKAWLNENKAREFIAMGLTAGSNAPVAIWGDHDAFDGLLDLAQQCAAAGEFAVLPLTDLLVANDSRKWVPKLHLIDAKRPNDSGEVPLGGSY